MSPKRTDALKLEGSFSIETAQGFKDRISEYISRKKIWILDLSGIESIDAAGLQLLLALKNHAKTKNANLVFTGDLQEEFINSLTLFGSDELLTYYQEESNE